MSPYNPRAILRFCRSSRIQNTHPSRMLPITLPGILTDQHENFRDWICPWYWWTVDCHHWWSSRLLGCCIVGNRQSRIRYIIEIGIVNLNRKRLIRFVHIVIVYRDNGVTNGGTSRDPYLLIDKCSIVICATFGSTIICGKGIIDIISWSRTQFNDKSLFPGRVIFGIGFIFDLNGGLWIGPAYHHQRQYRQKKKHFSEHRTLQRCFQTL